MKYIQLFNVPEIIAIHGKRPNVLLEYWYENLHLARRLWIERVEPKSVYLDTWTYGTKACFGSWLSTWPEFCLLGISNQYVEGNFEPSRPRLSEEYFASNPKNRELHTANLGTALLGTALFGEPEILSYAKIFKMTQHAEVILRIDKAIDKLLVELTLLNQESI